MKRTVKQFANIGAAGIMIEDQLQPKRCGHTKGKDVISRDEAVARIQSAIDARCIQYFNILFPPLFPLIFPSIPPFSCIMQEMKEKIYSYWQEQMQDPL